MPYLNILSEFRNTVRTEARTLKATNILRICDNLRDDVLPNIGVRLEDQEGMINFLNSISKSSIHQHFFCFQDGTTAVKLVDKETLLKEREEKKRIEREKAAEKEKKLALQAEKDALKKIPPSELFKKETNKYSRFDDRV